MYEQNKERLTNEQILKAARKKQQITHKGIPIRITADLYRQAKAERIQHHQTSSPINAKGYSLDRKHKKGV